MSSATFYPAAAGDTGCQTEVFYNTGDPAGYCAFGTYSSFNCVSWVRFALTGIPPAANITSAVLNLTAYTTKTNDVCYAKIGVNDTKDASQLTSLSYSLMPATVSWTVPQFTGGTTYQTPNISSVISAAVSRSGYESGDHILIVIENNGSDYGALRSFNSYSNGGYPSLDVTWGEGASTGSSSITIPSMSMDVFPLSVSGAVADMSMGAIQSVWFGGDVSIPTFDMTSTGYEYVAGEGAIGSMSLRINNNGLGGISCSATSAPLGDTTIPSATMSATAKPGNDGVMIFPVATMTGLVGARGEDILPLATVASWTTNPGNGVVAMTQMSMAASVIYANLVGQGVMTMRGVDAAAIGLVGRGGRAVVGVKMSMSAHGIAGQLASASPRMIPPMATGFASINLVGVMDTEMFQVESAAIATANSSEFTGPVVYEKGAVR